MAAVEEETGRIVQTFKDLFAGAVGGVAQVLLGPSRASLELRIYIHSMSHMFFDSCFESHLL